MKSLSTPRRKPENYCFNNFVPTVNVNANSYLPRRDLKEVICDDDQPKPVFWDMMMMMMIIIIIINLLTVIRLSPIGSGYFTYIQNMKLVTNKFKSGGLYEKHVVATWNVGNHLSICL